jgi:hypothetical protein
LTQEKMLPRLCSEIKLFDLCLLETCVHRDGRFCTNPLILEKFENISESEARFPSECCWSDDSDDCEETESSGFYYDDMADDDESDGD